MRVDSFNPALCMFDKFSCDGLVCRIPHLFHCEVIYIYIYVFLILYIHTLCNISQFRRQQAIQIKNGPLGENKPSQFGLLPKKTTRKTRRKNHHPSRVTSEGWKLRDRDAGCAIRRWGCRMIFRDGLLSVVLVVNSDSHGYSPMVYS